MQHVEKTTKSSFLSFPKTLLILGTISTALALSACGDAKDTPTGPGDATYKFEIYSDDLVIGNPDALVTIVEYSSMTCPHCAHFHETVYPTLKEKYLDTGHAKLVFRHYPLDGISAQASLLIACSNKERQMKLIDALFGRQLVWLQDEDGPMAGLNKVARQASFTDEAIRLCTSNKENTASLQRNMTQGQNEYAVTGTPSFFVNGEKVRLTTVAELDRIMANLVPVDGMTPEEPTE